LAFDSLREKLLLGGIAPRHVRRYLAELNEHLDDLTREQRGCGYDGEDARLRARARLGDDEELASAMLAQKGFRSVASRAPWAVFLLLPPVTAIAIGFLFTGSLVLTGKYFGFMPISALSTPEWFRVLTTGVVAAANLTMMPLTAALFVTIAQRQRLKMVWPLLATLVLLVLFFHSDVLFAPYRKGHLMIGFAPVFTSPAWKLMVEHWPRVATQYALTLLPLLWLYRKRAATAA
jgi:hypothetical protein